MLVVTVLTLALTVTVAMALYLAARQRRHPAPPDAPRWEGRIWTWEELPPEVHGEWEPADPRRGRRSARQR